MPTTSQPLFLNVPYSNLPDEIPNVSQVNILGTSEFPLVRVECTAPDDQQRFTIDALIDSGAGGCYVSTTLVAKYDLQLIPLDPPIQVVNADGSENKHGTVTSTVNLLVKLGHHRERVIFSVTHLGNKLMIIGIPWLQQHNPLGKSSYESSVLVMKGLSEIAHRQSCPRLQK